MTPLIFASDHGGFDLKTQLIQRLGAQYAIQDLGCHSLDPVDYPDYGNLLAAHVLETGAFGIAICGTGIGISIACNRHNGIRAALCLTPKMACLARTHNDANILCLGARLMTEKDAFETLLTFLETTFEGGRHEARVGKLG